DDEVQATLPDITDFKPQSLPEDSQAEPAPPLARAREWVNLQVRLDNDGRARVYRPADSHNHPAFNEGRRILKARREINTMPQWAGSCWYYLRFCDPRNDRMLVGPGAEQHWMLSQKKDGTYHTGGVDLYLG